MVRLTLNLAIQARDNLAAEIRRAPKDRDLPELLAEVRDSGLLGVTELASLTGLSKSRVYALLAEVDEERKR